MECLSLSLPYCLTASLPHCLTTSLPHCLTTSLPHYLTASLPHYLTVSHSHCLTASLSRSHSHIALFLPPHRVLDDLADANVQLSPDKCNLCLREIVFEGHTYPGPWPPQINSTWQKLLADFDNRSTRFKRARENDEEGDGYKKQLRN